MAGMIIGHLVVELAHLSLHHDTIVTPFLRSLKNHHLCHHYKIPYRFFAYGHKIEDHVWERVVGHVPKPVYTQ